MIREEAIEILKNSTMKDTLSEQWKEAYKMAIEALEQELCEDAINRQALLDAFGFSEKTRKWGGDHSGYNTMMLYEIQDMIESAPSVKPQYSNDEIQKMQDLEQVEIQKAYELGKIKTGHWIEYTRVLMPEPINRWEQAWYCSECEYGNQECEGGSAWLEWRYCPNCGAKMD